MYRLSICLILLLSCLSEDIANAQHVELKKQEWAFDGPLGKFDLQSIQRGFQVYKEVCSACHSVHRLAFRNLQQIGFSEEEVKSISSQYTVQDGPNDNGEMYQRPCTPADLIPGPYKNSKEARASNNGALPPDLSLIIKARPDGANYVYSLLRGYEAPPSNIVLGPNMYYNKYFIAGGSQITMPPPLISEGQVTYQDGTKATIDQMAHDVVYFLQWAAEPEMEDRKNLGVSVFLFTIIFTVLFYFAKKRIWKNISK